MFSEYSLVDRVVYIVSGPFIVLLIYTLCFFVNIPNWAIITAAAIIIKKKQYKLAYMYIAFISNIIMVVIIAYFYYSCSIDYGCRTSHHALGGSLAHLQYFFLGNLFWTLPFSYFVTKKV